jgi:GDPmannose 4,6-dehydratase
VTTALIVGGGGQDGFYIARDLLNRGNRVIVALRQGSDLMRWPQLTRDVEIVRVDVLNRGSVDDALGVTNPDQIYHLAGFTSVGASWDAPDLAIATNAVGTLNLLESVRKYTVEQRGHPVIVHASSSEIFAGGAGSPHDESSPVRPVSPYAFGKAAAKQLIDHYRNWFGISARSAILFSHESPLRTPQFLSRRISDQVAEISAGTRQTITLATLTPKRDWGFAGDYASAMIKVADHPEAEDFIVATGVPHSVSDWVRVAMSIIGISDWESRVVEDSGHVRPVDPPLLVGDASKATRLLDWKPSLTFEELVALMLEDSMQKLAISRT